LVLRELNILAKKEVGREELRSAKEQLKGGMLLGLETSESRMTKLARDEIYFKRTVAVEEIVKGIDRVTSRDIMRLARDIFNPQKITLVALGKADEKSIPKTLRFMKN